MARTRSTQRSSGLATNRVAPCTLAMITLMVRAFCLADAGELCARLATDLNEAQCTLCCLAKQQNHGAPAYARRTDIDGRARKTPPYATTWVGWYSLGPKTATFAIRPTA
eukprot:5591271-Lingulodinium_polyedra.AAC.1